MGRKTRDGLEILRRRFIDGDPEFELMLAQEEALLALGRKANSLRESAGLSEAELAERVGVTTEEIEALELANYDGDALSLLFRISATLGRRLEVRFDDFAIGDTSARPLATSSAA
jgi:DNA-binding XRE family transcriptional regulator